MLVRFRTETAYGNGGHSPAEILAYETFSEELSNQWLPEELCDRLSRYGEHPMVQELQNLNKKIENGEVNCYFDDYTLAIPFFEKVIQAFEEVTGKPIKYLLWLADFEEVIDPNMYGCNIESPIEEIDAYSINDAVVKLIEVMCDGDLYAFSTQPKPLDKKYVKKAYQKNKRNY